MKKIEILINNLKFEAELNDTETAEKIYEILSLEKEGNFWGNEIYFSIPVDIKNENPVTALEVGDLAYWPKGNGFCIFYGQTPASTGEKPRPASPVTKVGEIRGNLEQLKELNKARVKIKKME